MPKWTGRDYSAIASHKVIGANRGRGSVTAIKLTVRQTQVAILIGRGYSYAQIARELGLAVNTVRHHLVQARAAAGVRTSAQLAVMVALLRGKE